MHEQDSSAPGADPRRAQLLAAAEAVRTWVRKQRVGWSNLPETRVQVSPPPLLVPREPAPAAQPSVLPMPAPADAAAGQAEPGVREPRRERRRTEWQVGAAIASLTASLLVGIRTVGRPLVQWSTRLALAVLLLAILGGAAWKAREYWLQRPTSSDQTVAEPGTPAPSQGGSSGTLARTGRLQVESEPSGAKVLVDGRNRGVTPLTVESLTVGTHIVVLDSAKGTVRRNVAITANETVRISETIFTGWLAVASPIELSISEGAQTLRQDERDRFVLSPGSHELQLENRALSYRETRRVDIRPGEVTRISVTPPASTLAVTATLPAVVTIDGERVGETPVAAAPINLGTRDITVTAASGAVRRFTITVTVAPVRIEVDFSRP